MLPEGTVEGRRIREGRDRFQAFRADCGSRKEAPGLVSDLIRRFSLDDASHVSWAMRTGDRGSFRELKNDGGERGAGSCILDIMRRKRTFGVLVVVARWYGGRHLGSRRFRIYRDLTAEIL